MSAKKGDDCLISQFPSQQFSLTSFCWVCGTRFRIDQDKYPHITLGQIRTKVACPSCSMQGLSVHIAANDDSGSQLSA